MNVKIRATILLILFTHVGFAQSNEWRPLSIDSLFILVEQNSTRLKLSKIGIEAAEQAVTVAKSHQLPSIDFELSALYLGDAALLDRNFSNAINATMPHLGNNFSVKASYLVFAGSAMANTVSKASLEAQIASLNHKKALQDMRFLVAAYYLDLYKFQNQRKVFVKNIEQTEVLIQQVTARHQEGMALSNDLTRYELMLQSLKLALVEIDNNCNIINQQLVTLLDLPQNTVIEVDTTIQNINSAPTSLKQLNQIARENLPELRIAALNEEVATTSVKLSQSSYYPSIALIGGNALEGPITIEVPPIDKNLNYWYIGIGLKYNLASLYKSNQKVRLAKHHQASAEQAYQLEVEHSRTAIHKAHIKLEESFEKLRTYQKNVELATENYEMINNRYLNDLALITEMLDASNTKLKAELEMANAHLNIIYNHFSLLREIGDL